jgi:tetratricopeptide (TPR) repeat protein
MRLFTRRNLMAGSVVQFALVLALSVVAYGQTGSTPSVPTMEQANQAFAAKDWTAAAQAYEAITRADSTKVAAWLRLGVAHHKLLQDEKAIEALKHAEFDPQLGATVFYREAESLAKLNRKNDALFALDKAVDAGFIQTDLMLQDTDFAQLHDDPAFQKTIARADAIAHPCVHLPEYRQLDFWIGEWDVVNTQGQSLAGASSVQLILDQCVILENWTGGGTGKSFNHYDTRLKKWIQDWVDSQSTSVHFEGSADKAGVMHYYADDLDPQNKPIKRHLQFMPIDKDHVRQFSQASSDGGKTWSPQYDFTYIRKK